MSQPEKHPVSASAASRILIVDDDPGQRSLLNTFLKSQGFETSLASCGEEALAALHGGKFGMMISDVRMPGLSGIETLRRARETNGTLPVLLVTAYADIREAVDAMRDGAVNYLAKPIDLDELLSNVQRATGVGAAAPLKINDTVRLPENIVARSPLTQRVFRDAALIAPSDSSVLITGESGVGKEIVADVIHAWSARSAGPLVKVNCAAIPDNLLESELFGHEKGSFTGAHQQRIGCFEEADNGTIFLDEIGEMSPPLQAKLLRITQEGRFRRVGGNKELRTNTRILAATNRNLETQVKAGKFREDLFYRLNVVEMHFPPLRERPEDIQPLAVLFLGQFAKGKVRLSSAVVECLDRYSWPGNVRELRNAVERAVLLCGGEIVLPDHLPARIRMAGAEDGSPSSAAPKSLQEIELRAIAEMLEKHHFNRTETAKALGISRRALTYKLQQLKEAGYPIDPPPRE